MFGVRWCVGVMFCAYGDVSLVPTGGSLLRTGESLLRTGECVQGSYLCVREVSPVHSGESLVPIEESLVVVCVIVCDCVWCV